MRHPDFLLPVVFLSVLSSAFADERASTADCKALLPVAADLYQALGAENPSANTGKQILLELDLSSGSVPNVDAAGNFLYRMAFNNVAEGWSWQPQANPDEADYYRWKFFPVQSVGIQKPPYIQEEKIGVPQLTRVEWRYDYFMAFDNPYTFYRRVVDDDAGFSAQLPPGHSDDIRLIALLTLSDPVLSESTTFWKAIYGNPVDFTLKNRYFVGKLDALLICDRQSGNELALILPLSSF